MSMLRYYFFSFFIEVAYACIAPYYQILLRNKGYSQSLVGVILAISQFAALVFPLVNGNQIDKTGHLRRRLVSIMVIIMVCFWFFQCNLPVFVIVTVFTLAVGCCSCLNPALDSYLSNNMKGDSSRYGSTRAAGTMGYVALLVFTACVGFPDATDNFQIVMNITIMSLIFLVTLIFAPKYIVDADKTEEKKKFDFRLFDKSFYAVIAIVIVAKIAQAAVEMLLGSYMTEVLRLGNSFTFYVALGSFSEIFALIFAGRALKEGKISEWTLLFIACIALCLRLLIYAFTKVVWAFALAQCLHLFTFGCLHIAVTSFLSKTIDRKHGSMAMSIYWSFGTCFTQLLGSLAGGFIIDHLGYDWLFIIYAIFPVVAAILCLFYRNLIKGKLGL